MEGGRQVPLRALVIYSNMDSHSVSHGTNDFNFLPAAAEDKC